MVPDILSRMRIVNKYNRDELRNQFRSGKPFPHMVIDNFLDPSYCRQIADSYPTYLEARDLGLQFDALNEKSKIQITDSDQFPDSVNRLNSFLGSKQFLTDLSYITGIQNLLADEQLKGGGMHMTGPGGRLDVHIDFNFVESESLHRRLNILLYLNEEWQSTWGGQLELWDKKVRKCHRVIEPVLNRCVVFATSEISFHGVRPITRSAQSARKSFAAYYYTKESPADWDGEKHSTVFKARPDELVRGNVLMPLRRAMTLATSSIRRAKRFVKKTFLS